jgi:hypothetical protein
LSPAPPSSATPTTSPTPTPSPSPSAAEPVTDLELIAEARIQLPGTRAHIGGVVTVGPGLVGVDGLIAVGDSSGGIFVRLPALYGELPVGRSIEVEGVLAAPYGQLEIRELDWLAAGPDDKEPAALRIYLEDIGERTEGSLVTIRGTVDSVQMDGDRLAISIGDGVYTVRALADPPAGISRSDIARGDQVIATGIVGQHATATGRLDGYRLWLRRRTDIMIAAQIPTDPPATPRPAVVRSSGSPAGEPISSPGAAPGRVDIAWLGLYLDREVTVAGLVTAALAGVVTIDDGTGEVRIGGASAAAALATVGPGDAIEVSGVVRQDDQGLLIEADPASIIDQPVGLGHAEPIVLASAGSPGTTPTLVPTPAGSPAAAASVRIASAPSAPPDGAALAAVLLVVLGSFVAAGFIAQHPRQLRRPAFSVRFRGPLPRPHWRR